MPALLVPEHARPEVEAAVQSGRAHNARLLFYRYPGIEEGGDGKLTALKNVISAARFEGLCPYRVRLEAACTELEKRGFAVARFRAVLNSRLACGLGIASPFENGLTLHHVHGFPYIPGSSLKGTAQDVALSEREGGLGHPDIRSVFGEQEPNPDPQAGVVLFMDALPTGGTRLLDVDVTTVHYGEYYRTAGNEPPADWDDPNPVPYLVVRAGTEFLFNFAARPGPKQREALELAQKWVKAALKNLGVGAKTFSAGYGDFDV